MGWYTFFVGGNIAVIGWIHSRRIKSIKFLEFMSGIFALLNFGGIISSFTILWYLYALTDEHLYIVIAVCGIANTLVLIALLGAWCYILTKKTYKKVVVEEI